jgi:hypothetical protein
MTTQSTSSFTTRRFAAALALLVAATAILGARNAGASTSADQIIDAQMLVYEINEARWNPDAFRARSADITMPAGIPAAPPLAIVGPLGASGMFKANEMADHGYFGHQSAVTGVWPNRLARDFGYPLPSSWSDTVNNIESLHGGSPDPFRVLVSFANSESHRRHIFGEGWFFGTHRQIGVGRSTNQNYWAVHTAYVNTSDVYVTGVVYADANGNGRMDRGEGLAGVTVGVGGATTTTNAGGGYAVKTSPGPQTVSASGGGFAGPVGVQVSVGEHNVGVDFVSGRTTPIIKSLGSTGWGSATSTTPLCAPGSTCDTVTLVDDGGRWYRFDTAAQGSTVTAFYYGNPGDVPFAGTWNGGTVATPGLYRQSDGFAYLRHSNTQGNADVTFFFGNPSDVPLIGDFNGNGRDSVSLYRPGQTRVYIINRLGENGTGLGAADYSFLLGDFGDRPLVGDFDGDGVDTIGLYRPSTGWVYLLNSNSAGVANASFRIGTGWDFVFAGDWNGDGTDTIGAYRRSTGTLFLAGENSATTIGYSIQVGSFRSAIASPQS